MSNRSLDTSWRRIILALLVANFAFGLAVIAILPPFEGFDETAHLSRLQSQVFAPLSATKASGPKAEDNPNTRITMEVFNYYRHGPMPYQWIDFGELHQHDSLGAYMNYRDFFAQSSRVTDYVQMYRQSPLPSGYDPGPEPNWQYQHPPLYYLIVGQGMKLLAGHASLITTLFVLRLFSWIMAFAGFCIGLGATGKHLAKTGVADAAVITALGALYPFLVPEFFWEFARLGNDSVCLLLFGIIWAMLLWHIRAPRSDAWLYLGLFMGLGWLTKALMIPVSAGIVAFLVQHHIFVIRKNPNYASDWWQPVVKMTGLLVLIGAPVYLGAYLQVQSLGSLEFREMMNTRDFWLSLKQSFSWHEVLHGAGSVFYTFVWLFGDWSLMVVNMPVHRPLYIFTGIILLSYLVVLYRRTGPVFRLPLWILTPVILGLMFHILVMLVIHNDHATPGYYLHILAPCFALIYGLGLKGLTDKKLLKVIMAVFCTAVVMFNFFIAWAYMTAFSGCVTPAKMAPLYMLGPTDVLGCVSQFSTVMARLGVLAWPHLSLAAFGIVAMALITAGFLSCKRKISLA